MSTRSMIGRQNQDGTITAVYCHFDGYVNGVGEKLVNRYLGRAKVNRLIALGNLSSLAGTLTNTVAYHRDRGEQLEQFTFANKDDFRKNNCEWSVDFNYLYDLDGIWYVAATGAEFDQVEDHIGKGD